MNNSQSERIPAQFTFDSLKFKTSNVQYDSPFLIRKNNGVDWLHLKVR